IADATNLHRKPLAAIRCRDAARVEIGCDPWESSLATPERGHGDVSLLLLDAGVADHPGPALRLFLLELRHVRRAAATGQKMQLPVSFLDLRLVERRVNGPVELGNDGSRCFRWRADGIPGPERNPGTPASITVGMSGRSSSLRSVATARILAFPPVWSL